jgi:hypothetical protein
MLQASDQVVFPIVFEQPAGFCLPGILLQLLVSTGALFIQLINFFLLKDTIRAPLVMTRFTDLGR